MSAVAPSAPSSSSPAPKARALGLFSVLCIGINAIIGSGIYRLPGEIGSYLGGASWVAFGLVSVLLISVGLCFAEMAGMVDSTGGPYAYTREAFGRGPAFVVGWLAWVTMVVSWAAVANAVTGYASALLPALADPWLARVAVAALIVVPGALNYFGVRPGAYATNTFTIAKLLPLIAFVIAGLPSVDWGQIRMLPDTSGPEGLAPLGAAMFTALFAVQGFEVAPVPAGETANPRRNVPIAVVGSLIGCSIFYVLIQIVAYGNEPAIASSGGAGSENAWSMRPLADAGAHFFGPSGAALMAVGAVISMTGFCVGSALATPRFLGVLAEDGIFPRVLASLHPRFATPHLAIGMTTVVTVAAAQVAGFDELVNVANLAVTGQYIATCLAVIWLRRTKPDAPRSYRVPFGPYVVPLFGIGVCVLLLSQAAKAEWITTSVVLAAGTLVAGPSYWLSRRRA
jgi:amino acid transporter